VRVFAVPVDAAGADPVDPDVDPDVDPVDAAGAFAGAFAGLPLLTLDCASYP